MKKSVKFLALLCALMMLVASVAGCAATEKKSAVLTMAEMKSAS